MKSTLKLSFNGHSFANLSLENEISKTFESSEGMVGIEAVLEPTSIAYRVSVKSLGANCPSGLTTSNFNAPIVGEYDGGLTSSDDDSSQSEYVAQGIFTPSDKIKDEFAYVEDLALVVSSSLMIFDDYRILTEHSNMDKDFVCHSYHKARVGPRMRILCSLEHIFITLTGQHLGRFLLNSQAFNFVDSLIHMFLDSLVGLAKLPATSNTDLSKDERYQQFEQDLKSVDFQGIPDFSKYKGEAAFEYIQGMNFLAGDYLDMLKSEFGTKLTTLCSLLLCSPILNTLGITPSVFGYDEFAEKALRFDIRQYTGLSYPAIIVEYTTSILMKVANAMISIKEFGPSYGIKTLYISRKDFLEIESEYTWLKCNVKNFGCCTEVRNPKNLAEKMPFTLEGYFNRCSQVLDLMNKILPSLSKDPSGRARFERMKYDILGYQSDCAAALRVNDSRPCPYAIMLCGAPGIGKSMLKDVLLTQMHATDNINGRFEVKFSPSLVYTYNSSDDFYSGFSTSHTSIILDDIAQKKPDLIKQLGGDDLVDLIGIINTIAFNPNQAELEKKGNTPMRCRYVIGTTNTPDLSAQHVFNCVSAIYRRMIFVHCEVKKEYREEFSVSLRGDETNPENLDLWEFVIEQCRPIGERGVSRHYWTGTVWSSEKTSLSLEQLCLFVNVDLERHWRKQDKSSNAFDLLMNKGFCVHGISNLVCTRCKNALVMKAEGDFKARISEFCSVLFVIPTLICYAFAWFHYTVSPPKTYQKPSWFVHIGRALIEYLPESDMNFSIYTLGCMPPKLFPYLCRSKYYELYDRFFPNHDIYERFCYSTLKYWKYPAFVAALSVFWKFYKYSRVFYAAQSVMSKMPEPDAHEIVQKNHWLKVNRIGEFPASGSTVTSSQLETICGLNNVFLRIYFINGRAQCNALALKSNLFVTVAHVFLDEPIERVEMWQLCKNGEISKTEFCVDESCMYEDRLKDLMYLRLDRCQPMKDITKYLGSSKEPIHVNGPGYIIYKDKESFITTKHEVQRIWSGNPRPYKSSLKGVQSVVDVKEGYVLESTFPGMCGAPYIVEQSTQRMIVGVHCAGDEKRGTYVRCVYLEDVAKAEKILKVININDNEKDIAFSYNSEAEKLQPVHPKCPTFDLKHGEIIIIGGNVLPRVSPMTRVDKSPCVQEILNHYRNFGYSRVLHTSPINCDPKRAIMLSMEKAVENAMFAPKDVAFCVEAISKEFISKFSEEQLKRLTPYPWSVAINGCDGIPYLERLNLATSGGYGHTGPKKKMFTLVNSSEHHAVQYDMTPELKSEVDWIISQYDAGFEANPVFKSSFKDEPITFEKEAKNKVRIFSGSPVAFSLVCRRYLLCIIREFVGRKRLNFEMAIGANAHGRDWDDIARHVIKHGKDRCFAGDYKNFDKQMSPELILAAFDIIKNILKTAGWTDELKYVDGIARDIAFPTTDLFGTMVQLYGANPSGHVLTTPINSLVNSLYMRLACKSILEENGYQCVIGKNSDPRSVDLSSFSDVMSLVTYGDDNCGTTSPKYPFINHTSIQHALSKVGIIYTTDDKEAESKGLVNLDNITFLKRRFVFSQELKRFIAPLLEESIFKSLTVWTYSKAISRQEQLAAVLDSANREYFFYGRETFNIRHGVLQSIAMKYDVLMFLPDGHLKNYDELYLSIENVPVDPGASESTVQDTTSHLPEVE